MTNVRKIPTSPENLSEASKALWTKILTDYDAEDNPGMLEVLRSALEMTDRAEAAAAIIREEGLLVEGQRGIKKPHPATVVERSSRKEAANLFARLGLV